MQQVVVVERAAGGQGVDQQQPRRRPLGHRDRDGAVERDDRRRQHAPELVVEQRDLAPVGRLGARGLCVHGGDRRLQRVGAGRAAQGQRALDERQRLADHGAVPAFAILVLEQHELAVAARAGGAPRVLQQHQREQAGRLRLGGEQRVHDARETDRLGGEVLAHERVAAGRRVALVEHQVEHSEDRGEAVVQRVRRRLAERDAGQPHLLLRAHEPLGHGRLRQQQGARDLGHRQAADEPQRQRHLRLRRERRVAAGEHESEPLVRNHLGVLAGQVAHRLLQLAREQRLLVAQRRLAPEPVDRAPLRGRQDPRRRRGRDTVARPTVQRDGVGVLHRLLRAVDVATERACEDRDGAAELRPERACDRVGRVGAGARAQPCSNS